MHTSSSKMEHGYILANNVLLMKLNRYTANPHDYNKRTKNLLLRRIVGFLDLSLLVILELPLLAAPPTTLALDMVARTS